MSNDVGQDSWCFSAQDALAFHQAFQRSDPCVASRVAEYVDACRLHSTAPTARDTHQEFVSQLESQRSLLTFQRSGDRSNSRGKLTIVHSDWGRDFFRQLKTRWNMCVDHLSQVVTDLAMSTVLDPETERLIQIGSHTFYASVPGLVLQSWPSPKMAKQHCDSLHAVANAPLSALHVPCSVAVQVLGKSFVGMTLAPVSDVLPQDKVSPILSHRVAAVCATLRIPNPTPSSVKNMEFALGTDARLYVVDASSLFARAYSSSDPAQRVVPRRDILFGASGICTSPLSPYDFVLRHRVRHVLEQLVEQATEVNTSQVSFGKLLHGCGAGIAPFAAQVYQVLCDQERLFMSATESTSNAQDKGQRTQFGIRKRKFELCRSAIVTELGARVVKNLIREAWKRIMMGSEFLQTLRLLMSDGVDEEDRRHYAVALNRPFIISCNTILRSIFNDTTSRAPQGTTKTLEMFDELCFMINDTFVGRQFTQSNIHFDLKPSDLDPARIAASLSEMLEIQIHFDGRSLTADSNTDVLDRFFGSDARGGPLRRVVTSTAIELPIALTAGGKSKLQGFAELQKRIASRFQSENSSAQRPPPGTRHPHPTTDPVGHIFLILLAGDVLAAHRGHVGHGDYDDVFDAGTAVAAWTSEKRGLTFEADVSFRRALLSAPMDSTYSGKHLGRFKERCKLLVTSHSESALFLGPRLEILCRICEYVNTPALVTALEVDMEQLNELSGYGVMSDHVSQGAECPLSVQHCAHLYLPPLTLLVRAVTQPEAARTRNEGLTAAIKYSVTRRDVISAIYGSSSLETGIACNDIAAICSNNKFDLEKAEAEFERAITILESVQPEGPAIFVTQNNLAFLYFRKAERLKKKVAERAVVGREAVEARERGKVLLSAAESLLLRVIAAEDSVPPLDFAAACNNVAAILLFRSDLRQAKALFERGLVATRLQDQEHPCRLHAQKNLRVIARKLYLNAILRVQLYVRRFVRNMRNRRAVRHACAVRLLQRCGRGLLERLRASRVFPFSAANWWVRQPSAWNSRLDSCFAALPQPKRQIVWDETVLNAATFLQAVGRSMLQRTGFARAGAVEATFLLSTRPHCCREEATCRLKFVETFSIEAACLHRRSLLVASQELFRKELLYRMFTAANDLRRFERMTLQESFSSFEVLRRRQVVRAWKSFARGVPLLHERISLSCAEERRRGAVCARALFTWHELIGGVLLLQAQRAAQMAWNGASDLTELSDTERDARAQLAWEHTVEWRGLGLVGVAQRVGRGFSTRRLFMATCCFLRREEGTRVVLQAEMWALHLRDVTRGRERLLVETAEARARRSFLQSEVQSLETTEALSPNHSISLRQSRARVAIEQEAFEAYNELRQGQSVSSLLQLHRRAAIQGWCSSSLFLHRRLGEEYRLRLVILVTERAASAVACEPTARGIVVESEANTRNSIQLQCCLGPAVVREKYRRRAIERDVALQHAELALTAATDREDCGRRWSCRAEATERRWTVEALETSMRSSLLADFDSSWLNLCELTIVDTKRLLVIEAVQLCSSFLEQMKLRQTESVARDSILGSVERSLVGLFCLSRVHHYAVKLLVAHDRAAAQSQRELRRSIVNASARRVQRVGRGFIARDAAGQWAGLGRISIALLQTVGRAFIERRRLIRSVLRSSVGRELAFREQSGRGLLEDEEETSRSHFMAQRRSGARRLSATRAFATAEAARQRVRTPSLIPHPPSQAAVVDP